MTGTRGWAPTLALALLAFVLGLNELADFDIWWHLKTGELIPQRGVPVTDWYSFTSADRPWIDVHWGFQLLVAMVHNAFGISGLVLLKGFVVGIAVLLAAWPRSKGGLGGVEFGVLLVGLVVMSSRFYVRPEMLSLFFTSAYLWILLRAEDQPRLLWLLPLLQVAWSNVQGLFVFGPLLVGMYTAEALLRGRSYRGRRATVIIVALLVGLETMVSPYGWRNVAFLTDIWQKMDPEAGKYYRQTIGELMDLRTYLAEGGANNGIVAVVFLLMGLGGVGIVMNLRRIVLGGEWFRALPVVAFTWLAWQALRNGSHFGLVVGVLTARNLTEFEPLRLRAFWERRGGLVALALTLFIGLYFVGGRWSEWMGSHRRFGLGSHPAQYSFEGMRVAATAGMPGRVFVSHLGHAGHYIHAAGPERKVFMDPRLEVHSEAMLKRYREILSSFEQGDQWQRQLDAIGVDLVILSSEQSFHAQAALFSNSLWRCVHWDDKIGAFVRVSWPLPEGVTEFNWLARFKRIDQADRQPFVPSSAGGSLLNAFSPWAPQPSDQARESAALLKVLQALLARGGREELLERVLLRMLVLSQGEEEELARYRAIACGVLADRWEAPTEGDELSPIDLYRGVSCHLARRWLTRHPRDWTMGLYLQEWLAKLGEKVESLEVLQHLADQTPNSSIERTLHPEIVRLRDDRQAELARMSMSGEEPISDPRLALRLGRFDIVGQRVSAGDTSIAAALDAFLLGKPLDDTSKLPEGTRHLTEALRLIGTAGLASAKSEIAELKGESLTPAEKKLLARLRDLLLDEAQ